MGDDLNGRVFALWGLSFKPNTDDMREAPALEIVAALAGRGAKIVAYDPVAMSEARRAGMNPAAMATAARSAADVARTAGSHAFNSNRIDPAA